MSDRKSKTDSEKRIISLLRQLAQKLDTHSRQLLIGHDITMPQILCLDELKEKGIMAVSVLAKAIRLSPSTTVGIIDRLEKKGLVTRRRCTKDRRTVFIEITSDGRAFILKTPQLLHNKLHGSLKKLAEREKVQITESLDKLLLLLEKKD